MAHVNTWIVFILLAFVFCYMYVNWKHKFYIANGNGLFFSHKRKGCFSKDEKEGGTETPENFCFLCGKRPKKLAVMSHIADKRGAMKVLSVGHKML